MKKKGGLATLKYFSYIVEVSFTAMGTYVQGRRTLVLKLLIYFAPIIYEMGAVVIVVIW
jgi:hypothetical protein